MPTGQYTKTTWTTSTAITAARMNHLETQYDEIKYLIDHHDHDDRYYTETQSDTIFYHSGHMGSGSGADADLLDGMHFSDVASSALPIGAIMIWSGTDANVPQGWAICNGSNGTPDLRDRFVIGAGGSLSVGATGGSSTVTSSASLSAASHSLTVDEIPAHTHSYSDQYVGHTVSRYCVSSTSKASTTIQNRTTGVTANTGSGAGHSHNGSISFNAVSNIPPYYALYYIMKVA